VAVLDIALVVLVPVEEGIVEFELPLVPSSASSPSSSPASPPVFGGLVVEPDPVRPEDPDPELPVRDPDEEEPLELEPEEERPPDELDDEDEEELPPPPARGSRTEREFVS
jgi:hypothetical protein